MNQPKHSRFRRSRILRMCVLSGLLLSLLSAIFLQEALPAAAADASSASPFIGGKDSPLVNVLLVGQDSSEAKNRARADCIILCTFNKDSRELTLTSFLRDLYVPIPGYGSDRINAAYAYGGMDLLEKTLTENFSVSLDGTVEVDFNQFPQIIDLLGGVSLELREDEAELISQKTGTVLTAGPQLLNGQQTLAYARIRKLDPDGDFSRTSRQRLVMKALLDSYRDADLPSILKLANSILPMIHTDLGPLDILGYALDLFPLLSGTQLQQLHIPAPGTYKNQTIDGKAVLVPDMEAARKLLRETLLGA